MIFGLSTIRLVIIGVTVLALIASAALIANKLINHGYDKAIASVASRDGKALQDVRTATQKVDDCRVTGGRWDTVSGLCEQQ